MTGFGGWIEGWMEEGRLGSAAHSYKAIFFPEAYYGSERQKARGIKVWISTLKWIRSKVGFSINVFCSHKDTITDFGENSLTTLSTVYVE